MSFAVDQCRSCCCCVGEFVGLMFDETVSPDVRHCFEDILSEYSVFRTQQDVSTVSRSTFLRVYRFVASFSTHSPQPQLEVKLAGKRKLLDKKR